MGGGVGETLVCEGELESASDGYDVDMEMKKLL